MANSAPPSFFGLLPQVMPPLGNAGKTVLERFLVASAPLVLSIVALGCTPVAALPIRGDASLLRTASKNRAEFRSQITKSCQPLADVDAVIAQAILIGAPVYNAGSPLGCYRIYEGAGYKILYSLGTECPDVAALLEAGLAEAENEATINLKAWVMRITFDTILGRDTRTTPEDEERLETY